MIVVFVFACVDMSAVLVPFWFDILSFPLPVLYF